MTVTVDSAGERLSLRPEPQAKGRPAGPAADSDGDSLLRLPPGQSPRAALSHRDGGGREPSTAAAAGSPGSLAAALRQPGTPAVPESDRDGHCQAEPRSEPQARRLAAAASAPARRRRQAAGRAAGAQAPTPTAALSLTRSRVTEAEAQSPSKAQPEALLAWGRTLNPPGPWPGPATEYAGPGRRLAESASHGACGGQSRVTECRWHAGGLGGTPAGLAARRGRTRLPAGAGPAGPGPRRTQWSTRKR